VFLSAPLTLVLISAIADFGRTLRATPGLNTNQTCNQHQHCANFYTHVTTLGGIYYIFYMPFTEIDKESIDSSDLPVLMGPDSVGFWMDSIRSVQCDDFKRAV
jgi:hypothetical protein